MDCERVRERIHLYLDDRLSTPEADELKSHITRCEECQKELIVWEKLTRAVQNGPVVDPPTDFTENLKLSLPKHTYGASIYTLILWISPLLIVAALFALFWTFRSDIFTAIASFQLWKTLLWASVGCTATMIGVQIAVMLNIMMRHGG
jgi:anti-sigma factor RsiW